MRFLNFGLCGAVLGAICALGQAFAGTPRLDKETCDQLKGEQAKFVETGIMGDIQKGAEWGKANLSPERLREVEHFILLDEQLKFGCRQVTLTIDAMRAGEAARRLELNPNADPTAPEAPASPQGADKAEPANAANTALPGQALPSGGADTMPVKPPARPKAERRVPAAAKPKVNDAFVPQGSSSATSAP